MLFKRCKHTESCRCYFWYEFEIRGLRYRRSTRTANKQTAGRIEERRRVAILEDRDVDIVPEMLLSKHIIDYLAHTKEHNVTAYKDKAVLESFLFSTGEIVPLSEVSAFAVDRWKTKRAGEVSKSTVNRELNIIRGCFARAVDWGRLPASPLRTVKSYKVDDLRIRTLTDPELQLVLNCADPFVALVCRTTLECLPRLSEVLHIHRTHIGPNWIEFRRKGGKVARAAVTNELRATLLAHSTDDPIFGTLTEQTASNRIVRALRRLGIQDASHHTMRHSGVTLMLEHGVNPRVIQMLAGWSSLRMLERYGHARDTEVRRAVNENAAHLAALR